ncbi:Ribonuclease 3 [compost metagenome]
MQEALQARRLSLPRYSILSQSGEAHEQSFRVQCDLAELSIITTGDGISRRGAEQQAADAALLLLEQHFAAGKK